MSRALEAAIGMMCVLAVHQPLFAQSPPFSQPTTADASVEPPPCDARSGSCEPNNRKPAPAIPPSGAVDGRIRTTCPGGSSSTETPAVPCNPPIANGRSNHPGRAFKARRPDILLNAVIRADLLPPLRPVRIYLKGSDIPPAGIGAYGVVALRGRPTPATHDRLMRLCNSYVNYLPRSSSLPASVPAASRMATIWPIDNPDAAAARNDICEYLLSHYDVYGGLSAIDDAARQGANVSGPGPFLIGWSPSSARGVRDKVVLVYDMSSYVSQDSFDKAFIWWQQKIISDPKLWRDGWSIEKIRLSVRDFFDAYAQSALDAISFSSGGK